MPHKSVLPPQLPSRLSLAGDVDPCPLRLPANGRDDSHELRLPAEDISVSRARHAMDRWMHRWGLSRELREQAALVLSELATNAVTHTNSSWMVCGAALAPQGIFQVEVHDDDTSARFPQRRTPTLERESGRGLHIVEALAARWGVAESPVTRGNAVWAQLYR